MNNLMLFKSSVEDKNREIDNLIESIKLCKAQMTAKLSEKEKGRLPYHSMCMDASANDDPRVSKESGKDHRAGEA